MSERSMDRLLEGLEAEADKQAVQVRPVRAADRVVTTARAEAASLLDLLVRAGVASGTSVHVDGVTYTFNIESEAITDTTAERREDALMEAGREVLSQGLPDTEVAARFVGHFQFIAAAFAEKSIHAIDKEMHPHHSLLGRVALACGLVSGGLLGEPGGLVDQAFDDLTSRVGDDLTGRYLGGSVSGAVRAVEDAVGSVFGGKLRTEIAVLVTGGAATAMGAPAVVILGALCVGVVKELYEHYRESSAEHEFTQAAREQLPLRDRLAALEAMARLGGLPTPTHTARPPAPPALAIKPVTTAPPQRTIAA